MTLFLISALFAFFAVKYLPAHVPEGWQDDAGFHFGRPPKNFNHG
jgi:hypothetical protein